MKMQKLPKQSQAIQGLTSFSRCFRQTPVRVGVIGILMLTGGILSAETVLRPQVAQAYKNRVDVRLERSGNETYEALIQRAHMVARAAAQQSFDRDILMSEVSVMVMGEHQGNEVPLLLLEVSRQDWRSQPDTRRWATHYRSTKSLLQLDPRPDPVVANAESRSARARSTPTPVRSVPSASATPIQSSPTGSSAQNRTVSNPDDCPIGETCTLKF